jgi:hypothetical protein
VLARALPTDLGGDQRRTVAKVADAALAAAEDGLVHLVQCRQGPFDCSYLAVKATSIIRPKCTSALPPRRMVPPVAFAEAA